MKTPSYFRILLERSLSQGSAFFSPLLVSLALAMCGAGTLRAELFVVNYGSGGGGAGSPRVFRFDSATGASLGSFGYTTESYSGITQTSASEICVGSNILGRLEIYRFNRRGDFLGSSGSGDSGTFRGPDGELYSTWQSSYSSAVSVVRVGASPTTFIASGSGGMTNPLGVVLGPDGKIYVADSGLGVMRFNASTGALVDIFVPSGRGGLSGAGRIAFGPDGRLYVASSATHDIKRFDGTTGAFIDTFVAAGSGGLSQPTGLAFGPDGHLYVVSRGTAKVLRFNGSSGTYMNVAVTNSQMGAPLDLVFAQPMGAETVWFDDALPAGAVAGGNGDTWNWISASPAPYSGAKAHTTLSGAGLREHYFSFASEPMIVGVGDSLFVYARSSKSTRGSTWDSVMVSWCDDNGWEHRAYWGADLFPYGTNGTASRRYMGLVPGDEWQRLEVPAKLLGLEGSRVHGISFSAVNCDVTWDRVGKISGSGTGSAQTDTTPPTVSFTSPADHASVSGTVDLRYTAFDETALASVDIKVDGTLVRSVTLAGPQGISWNTTTVANGTHTVTATAIDQAGNRATASLDITVNNTTTTSTGTQVVWFDDTLPTDAITSASSNDGWAWITSSPAPQSGAKCHQSALAPGLHEHSFDWCYRGSFSIKPGDTLFAYVYLDPANLPREIMLSFRDANNWEHRAFWGEDLIGYGTTGTVSRRRIGNLPAAGGWQRLEIPASAVGLSDTALYGMSFALFDGRAAWDVVGKTAAATDSEPPSVQFTAPVNGSIVSGATTISVSANDDVGIASVVFKLDGTVLGTDTQIPFSQAWATTTASEGSHVLSATVTDSSGKTATATISVTVRNTTTQPMGGSDIIWVDDAVPTGASTGGSGGDSWNWVTSGPAPFSGSKAHQSNIATGVHEHSFDWASAPMRIENGDTLVAYVYLDPANLPREIMLNWNAGNWEHRAYWGENLITYGANSSTSRYPMGALPAAGQWVRLEVPASYVGLMAGSEVRGMSFTLFGGRATWDAAGKRGTTGGTSDATAPTVTLTSPTSGATVSDVVNLTATATDNVAVASVRFRVDGADIGSPDTSAPFSVAWNTPTVGNGAHTLVAIAVDTSGNEASSAPLTISVNNSSTPNAPPTAAVTAPNNNATVSGTVTIKAIATDSAGVASVRFMVDGAYIGNPDTVAPYEIEWNTTTVANGSHALSIRVTDLQGHLGESVSVIVSVNNSSSTGAVIWMDSGVPAGAMTSSSGGDTWNWITSNPSPYAGTRIHQSAIATGIHDHSFFGASSPLQVFTGDTLFAYVYIDPANVPSEIMLSFNDGNWEHRAYWGANAINYGQDGTNSQRYLGAIPVAGQWVKLEIPARLVGLEGRSVNGVSFTLVGGRATWDIVGKVGQ